MIAAIIDELCFFLADETGHILTDKDLLEAVEPSLASLDGRLICLSSPHAHNRRNVECISRTLWQKSYRR